MRRFGGSVAVVAFIIVIYKKWRVMLRVTGVSFLLERLLVMATLFMTAIKIFVMMNGTGI